MWLYCEVVGWTPRGSGQRPLVGCQKHGNESADSMKENLFFTSWATASFSKRILRLIVSKTTVVTGLTLMCFLSWSRLPSTGSHFWMWQRFFSESAERQEYVTFKRAGTWEDQQLWRSGRRFFFCRSYVPVFRTPRRTLKVQVNGRSTKLSVYITTDTFRNLRRSACVFSKLIRVTWVLVPCTRVGTLIVATIYLQLIQNRYMFRSFTVLHCSHQHCVQPVASDVEVVGYL